MSSATVHPPDQEPCPGCGRRYPPSHGPVHAYIGASAACWARYGELLTLEYADTRLMRWHRPTVDAYAAQHPGVPGRRSAQSVRVHLVGLCLVLERGVVPASATRALQKVADGRSHDWLDPPSLATEMGVSEAIAAAGTRSYADIVDRWARSVWTAWAPHHETISREAERALTSH